MTLRKIRLSAKKKNTATDGVGEDNGLLVKYITDSDVGKLVVGEKYCPRGKLLISVVKEENNEGDVNTKKSNLRKRGKPKNCVEEVALESDEEFNRDIKGQCERPSGLCDDEDVAGDEICSFRTPKKRQGMFQKALESAGKISNSKTSKGSLKTPSRSITPSSITTPSHKITPKKRMSVVKLTPSTRATPNKNSALKKLQPPVNYSAETPYNLRARHKKDIRAHVRSIVALDDSEDSDFEGSDDSSSDLESSDSSEEGDLTSDSGKGSEVQKPMCRRSLRFQIPSSIKKKGKETNYVFTAEDYFVNQGGKCSTSDRRLSRLQTPRLDSSALHDLLAHYSLSHAHILAERQADNIAMFKRWMFVLRCNYYWLSSAAYYIIYLRWSQLHTNWDKVDKY